MTRLALELSLPAVAAWKGGSGPSYSAEATTLFAAMSPAPDATRKGVIDTLIVALKAGGVWAKMDVFYVMAAHAAQPAQLNWKTPASFAVTAVNSPTFTVDRGYTGNGTTSYLNTGFASADGVTYTQNNVHLAHWSRTSTSLASPEIGSGNNTRVYARYPGDAMYPRINDGGAGSVTNTNASGLIVADRPSSGTAMGYRNGASLGSVASTATTPEIGPLTICGVVGVAFSDHQIAAASAGGSLTAGQHTSYYSAMQAYMTAVGA